MGHFDDLLAAEPGTDWDAASSAVADAPVVCRLALSSTLVDLYGAPGGAALAGDPLDRVAAVFGDLAAQRPDRDPGDGRRGHDGGAGAHRDRSWPLPEEDQVVELHPPSSSGSLVDAVRGALLDLDAADPRAVHLDAAAVEVPGSTPLGVLVVDRDERRRHGVVRELAAAGAAVLSADRVVVTPGTRSLRGLALPVRTATSGGWAPLSATGRRVDAVRADVVVTVGERADATLMALLVDASTGRDPSDADRRTIDHVAQGCRWLHAGSDDVPSLAGRLVRLGTSTSLHRRPDGPSSAAALPDDVAATLRRVLDAAAQAAVEPLVIGAAVLVEDGPERAADAPARADGDVAPHPSHVDGPVPRLDLLVDTAEVDGLVDGLVEIGMRSVPTSTRVGTSVHTSLGAARPLHALVDETTGVPVGLHVRLSAGPFGELVRTEELVERSVPVLLTGRWCRSLHPLERFVLACVQLDQAAGRADAAGREALVAQVLATVPDDEVLMAAALDASDRWGATRAVLGAVRTVSRSHPGLAEWWVERADGRRRPRRRAPGRRRR